MPLWSFAAQHPLMSEHSSWRYDRSRIAFGQSVFEWAVSLLYRSTSSALFNHVIVAVVREQNTATGYCIRYTSTS